MPENGEPTGANKPTGQEDLRSLVRKQAAALQDQGNRLRSILHSIPLGLVVFNKSQTIELINTLAQQLLHFEPRELKGQHIRAIFPELEMLQFSAEPVRTMAKKKTGEKFPVEIYMNEWDNDLIFAHLQDITERHRLERLRQDFLAMVSHDLRSPLSSVQIFLQMISSGTYCEISPTFEKNIARAESSLDLMVSLVNDLLDSEQLDSGDFNLDIQPTTTNAIVEKAINSTQGGANAVGVRIERDVVNDSLNADEDRVSRVIVNLIGNAVKFSPKGGVITVQAGIEGTNVLFRIKDQGPGIPDHLHTAIFERYKQLDQPKETKRRGVGLGLAICKAIVEKHRGKIWVESEVGKGASFCFTIPTDGVSH